MAEGFRPSFSARRATLLACSVRWSNQRAGRKRLQQQRVDYFQARRVRHACDKDGARIVRGLRQAGESALALAPAACMQQGLHGALT